ncbi:hypothetical protein TRFO_35356 [Tritrichomonas foetus]|uniref:Ubiquitin-like domain-containing protein n=1 Tax=Tritrichomonas foetus TaxID=1144522 RepID=A0A1J4JGI0_9EUKA|nr:hypothetical protein TRFO_35356 [Tritrichomonas foetus]|eukprot:OHS98264.1 hypothetical protein TRFO_35356 [Tritrichomonas foetus]
MEMMNRVLRIRWTWGGAKIVKFDASLPVKEVLIANGFEELPGSNFIIACKGKLLNPYLTFDAQDVKNGSTIIVNLKYQQTREKSRKFLESLQPKSHSNFYPFHHQPQNSPKLFSKSYFQQQNDFNNDFLNSSQPFKPEKNDDSKQIEISRLNDIAFSAWETVPEYPIILKEMLMSQEDESIAFHQRRKMHGENITYIETSEKICEDPLPNPFTKKSTNSIPGLFKSIYEVPAPANRKDPFPTNPASQKQIFEDMKKSE